MPPECQNCWFLVAWLIAIWHWVGLGLGCIACVPLGCRESKGCPQHQRCCLTSCLWLLVACLIAIGHCGGLGPPAARSLPPPPLPAISEKLSCWVVMAMEGEDREGGGGRRVRRGGQCQVMSFPSLRVCYSICTSQCCLLLLLAFCVLSVVSLSSLFRFSPHHTGQLKVQGRA